MTFKLVDGGTVGFHEVIKVFLDGFLFMKRWDAHKYGVTYEFLMGRYILFPMEF
jgi:hypothetical protein